MPSYDMNDKEVIVKYKGWVVYKGSRTEYYTFPRRNARTLSGGRSSATTRFSSYDGNWIQHDHYHGGIVWASWLPHVIDNKCSSCLELLNDTDLAKLLCFAKAIK